MMKINKIIIENFRGIKSPVIIDFVKGGNSTSALIYGRNGTGKSSIVDAWEWLINSKIEYLTKEGISERDYPHRLSNGDNVYIKIDLKHPTINFVKALFNKLRITSPTYSGEFTEFKTHTVYPNYLRYSDLQEFVYKTKGDKYKYIAKFFGLEKFIKNQSDLQASSTRISNQLQHYQNQLFENGTAVEKITGSNIIDEITIVTFINQITAKYKIEQISKFKDTYKVKDALSEIVKANPVAAELTEWKAFQNRLNQFYPLPPIIHNCINIETVFKDLKHDEANITKLILLKLYATAAETLAKLEDKTKCPVCDSLFEGNLEQHISEKYKSLDDLNKKKTDYITIRKLLIKALELIVNKVVIIQSETSEKVIETFNSFWADVALLGIKIPVNIAILQNSLSSLPVLDLSTQEDILIIGNLIESETTHKTLITAKIKQLSEDENTKNLATDFGDILHIITAFTTYLKNDKKVLYLNTINTKLDVLLVKLTSYIQAQIQNTFSAIQTNVIDCYNYLETTNQFLKNPEIKLVTGKDKSVELEIEFVNEKISPAHKFMSESQVNSFGLAIFLSAVKYFNSSFKFIILDDVVNSFDAFKRPRVSQLLALKFTDFQVLMLTHDQIFFDTVQRDFPQWNRYKFASWDYTTGPRCYFSNNYNAIVR